MTSRAGWSSSSGDAARVPGVGGIDSDGLADAEPLSLGDGEVECAVDLVGCESPDEGRAECRGECEEEGSGWLGGWALDDADGVLVAKARTAMSLARGGAKAIVKLDFVEFGSGTSTMPVVASAAGKVSFIVVPWLPNRPSAGFALAR